MPGAVTLALCLVVWQGLSLLFLPVFFPGPAELLDRTIEIYSRPAAYLVVGRTLSRILAGFAIYQLLADPAGRGRSSTVFMSDRIYMMSARPARIFKEVLMLILEHGVFARLEHRAFAWRPLPAR